MVSMNLILVILILPPIVMMSFLVDKKTRFLLLFLAFGMISAYVAGQVNSIFYSYLGLSSFYMSIHVSPIIEEFLKAFPVVLYLFAFKPKRRYVVSCAAATGLGFAFFENSWAFAQSVSWNPTWQDISFALSRGFGASLVHSLCTLILVYGISLCMRYKKLVYTGTFALFSLVCIFHSLFNVLVQSAYAIAPFLLTVGSYVAIIVIFFFKKKHNTCDKEK